MERISRRRFVHQVVGTSFAAFVLQACGPIAPPSSAPAAKPATGQLPTYVAFKGPEPDLPGTAEGVQPAYVSYPKSPPKSVAQAPLKGGEATGFTNTVSAPPLPLEQNAAWQEVNKQLGGALKLTVVSSADYSAKLNTLIAGEDLPEMVYVNQGGPNPLPNLLTFLQAKMMDLTPFLSGDAVKDYPNLANLPVYNWKGPGTFYNGQIWGVPIPRPVIPTALMVHEEMLEQIGAQMPKNADDFRRVLGELTRPQANVWGMGSQATAAFNVSNVFAQMHGAPNNWRLESGGKLVKNYETEEFKAGVGFARDLYQAGVFHPDSHTNTNTAADQGFTGGKFAFFNSTWTGFSTVFWPQALRVNPATKLRPVAPFSANSSIKLQFFLGPGNFGNTYLRKTSPERTRELLGVLNFLAAPFGTQEQMLLQFGLPGVDYNLDAGGNPASTPDGFATKPVPWRFLTQYPSVIYNSVNSAEFAKVAHAGEQAMIPPAIQDPTLPLYSPTFANRNANIQTDFLLAMTDIVIGRRPLTEFDQVVRTWREAGGDKMRDEFSQALAGAKT